MNPYSLSQSTIEKLGYYVYILKDPRSGQPFYIGKGCGNRINHHLVGALETKTLETDKIKTIRDIQAEGLEVELTILRHGLTEDEALNVESAVIDLLGIKNLTNLVQGHHAEKRGAMSLADLKIEYEAKKAVFKEPVLLINLNRRYRPDMTKEELYEGTRGHWKVGARAKGIRLVCAVYRGIIREVFVASQWHLSEDGRSYFDGAVAPPEDREKYLHTSVSEYWKQGSQNPIKYVA